MPVPGLSLLGLKRIRGFASILRYINPTIIIIIIIWSRQKLNLSNVMDLEFLKIHWNKPFMAVISHVTWDYPIKRPYISLIIATRGSKCENNLYQVMAWDYFEIADFYLWPLLQCQVGSSYFRGLKSPLVLHFTDSEAGDNCCGSGLVFYKKR